MKGFTKGKGSGKKFIPTGSKKGILSKKDLQSNKPSVAGNNDDLMRRKQSLDSPKDKHVKEFNEKEVDYEYDRFLFGMNERGTGDIANAVRKAHEVGIGGMALSDMIREYADDTETPIEDVDENYVIYDHVMNEAGSLIEAVTGYDVRDDWEVYANHLATSYNPHGDEDKLAEEINKLSKEKKEDLLQNKFVHSFIDDTDVSLHI